MDVLMLAKYIKVFVITTTNFAIINIFKLKNKIRGEIYEKIKFY